MASYVKEYLTAVHINLAALVAGSLHRGFGYLIEPFCKKYTWTYSAEVIDLMGTSNSFGIGTGALIALLFLNLIGRKKTLMLFAISCILGWIVIMAANSYFVYIYIEFINGVTIGLLFTVVPIFIGEIASDKIRGSLGCLLHLMFLVGYYFTNFLENVISYQVLSYIFILLPIFMILTYKWLPETPTYSLLQQNDKDARKSLKILRNNRNEEEFNTKLENFSVSATEDEDISELLPELWKNRKSLLVIAVCAVAMHFSTAEVFSYYYMPFLSLDNNEQFNKVIMPTSILTTKILGLVTIDWIGRRKLLLFSSTFSVLANIVSGVSFFMEWNKSNYLMWIPLLAMVISIFTYGVGFNTISFVLLGELFPTKIKDVAAFLFVLLFAVIRRFSAAFLIEAFDLKYQHISILNIVIMFIATVVIFIVLPETKGKSLTEIQAILHNKPQKDVVVNECTQN